MKKLLNKLDIFIIVLVILVFSSILFIQKSEDGVRIAEISVNGEVIERINLDDGEKKVIIPDTSPGMVIVSQGGEIYFESADCRDKICVKSGRLRRRGDTAVCLPAKTVITVSGGEFDAVTY